MSSHDDKVPEELVAYGKAEGLICKRCGSGIALCKCPDAEWLAAIESKPVKSCGRLDMHTYLPEPATVGRVTSDRVRYVYFEDDTESVVLGDSADHVAFRAFDYERLRRENERTSCAFAKLAEENEKLKEKLGTALDAALWKPPVELVEARASIDKLVVSNEKLRAALREAVDVTELGRQVHEADPNRARVAHDLALLEELRIANGQEIEAP